MSLTWRLYRDNGLIKLFRFAVIAKIGPYRLATWTLSLLATGTTDRLASPVTQTPSIAVPLCVMRSHPENIESFVGNLAFFS
jgi:hypothetical protein